MTGFGGMSGKGDTWSDLEPEEHAEFVHRATTIFPENTASRLARAGGNVANRTAQKWLSSQMTPHNDIINYVNEQYAIYQTSTFYDELLEFYHARKGDLDDEVAMAMLARLYAEISGGYGIR